MNRRDETVDNVPLSEQIAAVRHYLHVCRIAGASVHSTKAMRAVLATLLRLEGQSG